MRNHVITTQLDHWMSVDALGVLPRASLIQWSSWVVKGIFPWIFWKSYKFAFCLQLPHTKFQAKWLSNCWENEFETHSLVHIKTSHESEMWRNLGGTISDQEITINVLHTQKLRKTRLIPHAFLVLIFNFAVLNFD